MKQPKSIQLIKPFTVDETRHLIIRARQGDAAALNQLFTDWYRHVYNIAYRYFSDAERASEVSQQTFITVQQKLGQLKDPAGFRLWLYRTVINHCHSEARQARNRARRRERYQQINAPGVAPGPEVRYEKEEQAQYILAALQQLPEEQRTVLILKEYEGLKFREIAELLDLPENTVKSRLYYGLKALRHLFLTNKITDIR